MPTREVFPSEHFDQIITDGVASGQFSNAGEVVREGLSLLEERQPQDRAQLASLRSAVQEGINAIDRGDRLTMHSAEDIDDFMQTIHRQTMAAHREAESKGA